MLVFDRPFFYYIFDRLHWHQSGRSLIFFCFCFISTVTYHRVQHELCAARALHIRGEIQRTADGDAGGGRVLAETAIGLQIGASAQHHVIRLGDALTHFFYITQETIHSFM